MEILTGEIDLCVNGETSYENLFYDVYYYWCDKNRVRLEIIK